jgi:hypothetical protein
MVLFSGNNGTTRKKAETAFDSDSDAPMLLPVQTELRRLPVKGGDGLEHFRDDRFDWIFVL